MSEPENPSFKMPMPWTIDTWHERYKGLDYDLNLLTGFLECLDDNLPALENMAKTAQNFEELKKQLLDYCKGQRDMVNDIHEKWDSEDSEKYHLGRLDPNF